MRCDWTRAGAVARVRPPVALLARLAVIALIAVAALSAFGPAARADGDPGSDVLVSHVLFLPADANVPARQQAQLSGLLKSANRSGLAIRVAVIATPDDLGAVTALWRKPAAYARFLGVELSLVYKQRLLVVMPDGFGFNWPGHSPAAAERLLAGVPAGANGGLAGATEAAVRGLAAAAGIKIAGSRRAAASSGGGGAWRVVAAALAAVLAVAAAISAFLLARRRLRRRRGPAPAPRGRGLALRHPWRLAVSGALVLGTAAAAGTAYAITRTRNPDAGVPRPSGIPASISTSLASQMAIDPLGHRAAPGFTLTDQTGQRISLDSFRGKVVVLDFMDDHCTNICPIVSQEFAYAYRDLGPLASKAVFIAVNVNPFYRSVQDVAAFTNEQRLTAIPDWHYFTGTLPELTAVWRDYHITITAPNHHDVIHTSAVYIIGPRGGERYLADAGAEVPEVRYRSNGDSYIPGGTEPAWGQGIAKLVRATLAG